MPNKLRETAPGHTFLIFGPRIEKGSWVVYFLLPFFLFMSFSFYEPWVNTAHVNDILTQRAMNNAFEFTFMLELDPSQHPISPPFLSSWFPPLHPSFQSIPPCFFSGSSSLHYSSSSELNLIFFPRCAPSLFSLFLPLSPPPTPPSDSRGETVRDQTPAFWTADLLYHCFSFRPNSGGCSLIYFSNHKIRNGDRHSQDIFAKATEYKRLNYCLTRWFITDQWAEIK